MTSNATICSTLATLSEYTQSDDRMTDVLSILQQITPAHQYLVHRIAELRQDYAGADRAIKADLKAGQPRYGKPKLSLPLSELVRHMEQRDARVKCQHLLLLLVPMERLVRAAMQQRHALNVKSSRQLPSVKQLLSLRCSQAFPQAKEEVAHLFKAFPSLFVPLSSDTAVDQRKKVNADKAQALHSKLLASGLLNATEIVTLREVFNQYRP